MARRSFLSQIVALPFLGLTAWGEQDAHKSLKIMMKSAWGSDDPTKAAFPFLHGLALGKPATRFRYSCSGRQCR